MRLNEYLFTATGDVTHIVNSKDIHIGNVMYFGPQQEYPQSQPQQFKERVQMDNSIMLLMEAKIKVTWWIVRDLSKHVILY